MEENNTFFQELSSKSFFIDNASSNDKKVIEFLAEMEKYQSMKFDEINNVSHYRLVVMLKHGEKALNAIDENTFKFMKIPKEQIDNLIESVKFEIKKLKLLVALGTSDIKNRSQTLTDINGKEINVITDLSNIEEIADREAKFTITKRISTL